MTCCCGVDYTIPAQDRPTGTNLNAVSATQAAVLEEHQVWLGAMALRIVAPPARQWTPFEKHRGSNTRAVVQGIAHDVKEEAGRFRRRGVGGLATNCGLVVFSCHLLKSAGQWCHLDWQPLPNAGHSRGSENPAHGQRTSEGLRSGFPSADGNDCGLERPFLAKHHHPLPRLL